MSKFAILWAVLGNMEGLSAGQRDASRLTCCTSLSVTVTSPVQLTPLPLNPVLQLHLNDPSVLVHKALHLNDPSVSVHQAFTGQLWLPVKHSSLSVWLNRERERERERERDEEKTCRISDKDEKLVKDVSPSQGLLQSSD